MTAVLRTSDLLLVFADLAALSFVVAIGLAAALKGKPGLVASGLLLTPVVWLIGSVRLAKPNSYWARRFYRGAKLDRAEERFPAAAVSRDRSALYATILGVIFSAAFAYGAWHAF